MNIQDLENKKILLFGKSRSFSEEELQMQLKSHSITLTNIDEVQMGVDFIVDGVMMTPLESLKSEELYNKQVANFLSIEILDKLLSSSIDEDVLMMSLKLSSDKERLKNFLRNDKISDEFYLRLLKMYDWGDDDFYENDSNRDISASLIKRFYKNIERNHNIEFSKLGLMHLIVQTNDAKVIETVANLKPLKSSFKADKNDQGFKIVTSIATHLQTPASVLKMFIKESGTYVKTLIAMRENLDDDIQVLLFNDSEDEVLKSLSFNKNMCDSIYKKLRDNPIYAKNMAHFIKLDREKYDFFKNDYMSSLAKNETLEESMQKDVIDSCTKHLNRHLAKNKNLSRANIIELLSHNDDELDFEIYSNPSTPTDILYDGFEYYKNHFALACNENTPREILEEIYKESTPEIKMALAENSSTPIDILYQLQLDSKYERYVKENPSFGKHIQEENIGWLV